MGILLEMRALDAEDQAGEDYDEGAHANTFGDARVRPNRGELCARIGRSRLRRKELCRENPWENGMRSRRLLQI